MKIKNMETFELNNRTKNIETNSKNNQSIQKDPMDYSKMDPQTMLNQLGLGFDFLHHSEKDLSMLLLKMKDLNFLIEYRKEHLKESFGELFGEDCEKDTLLKELVKTYKRTKEKKKVVSDSVRSTYNDLVSLLQCTSSQNNDYDYLHLNRND